jgi:squalene synthase HpnC
VSTRTRTTENFPVGSWLVAREHRPAVHAFYRFARAADDIADAPALDAAAKTALLEAHDRALADGNDGPDEALALRAVLLERGLTLDHPRHLLQAFLADARGRPCRTWSDLLAYCRFSAAPVGRFLLDLHGEDRALWPASDALCAALQVENHLQDAAGDWLDLHRLYIPKSWLDEAGLSERDLLAPSLSAPLRAVYDRVLERVDALNAQARPLAASIRDRRLRMETAAIVDISRRLARALRRRDPLASRVELGPLDKGLAVARGIVAGLFA